MKFLYDTIPGRILLKLLLHTGILKLFACLMRSPFSKIIIKPYIKIHHIDMSNLCKNEFDSFADFFSRKRINVSCDKNPSSLISPCDSLLSVFPIKENSVLHIKDSWYLLRDLIPSKKCSKYYEGGLCMIFRLQASDYHRFCYIDDCYHGKAHFIPGLLHSVQPIACNKEPVYRLNRRMWSVMKTKHFRNVAQIEVGALLVGGMIHEKENAYAKRGEEMGRFELAGSTIVLLLHKSVGDNIEWNESLWNSQDMSEEIPVKIGQSIGVVNIKTKP